MQRFLFVSLEHTSIELGLVRLSGSTSTLSELCLVGLEVSSESGLVVQPVPPKPSTSTDSELHRPPLSLDTADSLLLWKLVGRSLRFTGPCN